MVIENGCPRHNIYSENELHQLVDLTKTSNEVLDLAYVQEVILTSLTLLIPRHVRSACSA